MKDSSEFDPIFLKPVLVEIGEDKPVPVLVPAERRIQTQADKLTSLQMEILRVVGMEMFAVSGIKSNQLDEILSPTTKRASKYHRLNTLIRLGYIEPHVKGDPYKITEAGRLKLSNAENSSRTGKSNVSKANPGPFIWTLPEPSPMSSPFPHTSECGMDQTLDQSTSDSVEFSEKPVMQATDQIADINSLSVNSYFARYRAEIDNLRIDFKSNSPSETLGHERTDTEAQHQPSADTSLTQGAPTETPITTENQAEGQHALSPTSQSEVLPALRAMSQSEIARYADQLNLDYLTSSGADLYRIAEIILAGGEMPLRRGWAT